MITVYFEAKAGAHIVSQFDSEGEQEEVVE
jgi:hypothetical protein